MFLLAEINLCKCSEQTLEEQVFTATVTKVSGLNNSSCIFNKLTLYVLLCRLNCSTDTEQRHAGEVHDGNIRCVDLCRK